MALTYHSDHLHLRSADPVAAARFYVEVLNAREVSRGEVRGALRIVLDLCGLPLFIEKMPAGTKLLPEPPHQGIEHIGLRVDNLDEAARELRRHGISFLGEPKQPNPGVRFAFIQGPDGVRIELVQRSAA